MLKRLVILDGNHLAYRAYYKFMNLKTLDGVRTGVIFGMPYVAESLIRRLGPDKAVVVFDGGRSKFRKGLLPNYKEREKKLGFDAENFFWQKDEGRDLFMSLGLQVAYQRHEEADDIIYSITREYSLKEWNVIIVSGDKDFNQVILPYNQGIHGEVTVYNVGKGKEIGYTTLPKLLGYKAEQTVDYLCLTGDKSDNIPGYPGVGPKRALKFLEQYGSIRSYLKSGEQFGKIDRKKLRQVWRLNRKLIDLRYYYQKFNSGKSLPWLNEDKDIDMERLKRICFKYEINSFIKPQFLKTFKNLES